MIIGIVGAEAAKFTEAGELAARALISRLLDDPAVTLMVSGGCHLGGADIYAEEEARRVNMPMRIHKPKRLSWDDGYKARNMLIAEDADIVHNIVVDVLPSDYVGMRFKLCYHCNTTKHVKSGGCWTAKHALGLGKQAQWYVIENYPVGPKGLRILS